MLFKIKKSFLTAMVFIVGYTFSAIGQTTKALTPLPNFGPNNDGSLRPGDATYVSTGSYQRGIAVNPATGNLIFVDRQADGSGTNAITGSIYVLDPLTGASITTLNTNGMGGGNYADCTVSVSDDGVIYVANLVNAAATAPFTIYRWESDTSTNPPVIVYSGDPAPGLLPRWGETMDVRGSSASTQILIGSKTQNSFLGTNVVIFTAGDSAATNFVSHPLYTDLAGSEAGTSSEPGMGVAFGAGNTFWTKHKSGAPLRQLSFDLSNSSNATTIRVFGTNIFASSANLGSVAVDTVNNLMALADLSTTTAVRLYDISNLTTPPVLLAIKPFPTAIAPGTAGAVYLDFGGGKLYAHSINNGIMGFSVDTVSMVAPTFITQPSGTLRVPEGRNVSFEVFAQGATSYQWQKNGANITGATKAVLTFPSVVTTDAGTYSANIANAAGTTPATSSISLDVVSTSNLFRLVPMWVSAATTGNTLTPAATNYVNQGGTSTPNSTTPNQRTIAYSAISNQLFVVSRASSSSTTFTINVINGTTGAFQYALKTTGISGGAIGLVGIAVADDGAVYACNMDTTSTTGATAVWKLYRWADSGSNTLPTVVFTGEPSGQTPSFRWGDVLTARGSGTDTQLLINNVRISASVGLNPYISVLVPSDSTLTNFVSHYSVLDGGSPMTPIGRSVQFAPAGTNEVWYKNKGTALLRVGFDPFNGGGFAGQIASYSFPSTLAAANIDFSRNLLAGIDYTGSANTAPDSVALYDISDISQPLLINHYNFPINQIANANFIGQVIMSGNYLFALDSNNGLMAFSIASGPLTPPTILAQPAGIRLVSGQSGSLSVSSPDTQSYQWRKNGSNIANATNSIYTISNAQVSDAAPYSVVLTNAGGAITSSVAIVSIISSNDVYQLAQKWQFQPGTNNFGTFTNDVTYNGGSGTPNERTIAYNPQANELYIVQRSGTEYAIHVVDATTGTDLRLLNTNNLVFTGTAPSGQNYVGLVAIGVGEDGAIYASCLAPDAASSTGLFRLFRWANSASSTVPAEIFSGDPADAAGAAVRRWGDVMDVRGSGLNTQIVMNNNQGTVGAILVPTDATLTNFSSTYFNDVTASSPIGKSLQYSTVGTNYLWQKRSTGDLQLFSFDLASNSSTLVTNYSIFPGTMGPAAVDTTRNILVGINFATLTTTPDTVEMYDISTFSAPTLRLSSVNFPMNHQANQNFIGQVILSGNKVFALSGNNGLIAFDLVPPATPQIAVSTGANSITLAWPASLTGFSLQSTPSLSPPSWTNVATPVVTNNGQNTVTVPMSGTEQYFRLIK